MGVPIFLIWKCLVDAVVKVFVVGENNVATNVVFKDVAAGNYEFAIGLRDKKLGREIDLPIAGGGPHGIYRIGTVSVKADKPAVDQVK